MHVKKFFGMQSELKYLQDFIRYGDKEEKKMVQSCESVVLADHGTFLQGTGMRLCI